jgi:hypothetical protein
LEFSPERELVVSIRGEQVSQGKREEISPEKPPETLPVSETSRADGVDLVQSCETCGVSECFLHRDEESHAVGERAWLLDAFWPEYASYMKREASGGESEHFLVPLRDHSRYPWPVSEEGSVTTVPWFVLKRSLISRKLASQGAARQRALLGLSKELADRYSRRVPHRANHLVVSQDLLPFLWQNNTLAGRTFDVLMTRWPIRDLQFRLDDAVERWPESTTLADFRADEGLVEFESEALQAARKWITPHSGIAANSHSCRIELLDWTLPECPTAEPGDRIVFPASTLGRNGAWELREAMQGGDFEVHVAGANLESEGFWDGLPVFRQSPDRPWHDGAGLVVLPAWTVHRPRRILEAIARGIPVIVTENGCGLGQLGEAGPDQVDFVPEGDAEALRDAILRRAGG